MSKKLETSPVISGCLLLHCIFELLNQQPTLQTINMCMLQFPLRCIYSNMHCLDVCTEKYICLQNSLLTAREIYDNYFLFHPHGENHYTLVVASWIPITLLCADCLQYTHGEKLTTTSLQDSFPHTPLNLMPYLSYFLKDDKYAQKTPIYGHH